MKELRGEEKRPVKVFDICAVKVDELAGSEKGFECFEVWERE